MKKIGVVLHKPLFSTVSVFIKELKKKKHIKYFKIKKLLVDSNFFDLKKGDVVEMKETRKLSKNKNFLIIRKLNI